MLNHFSRLKETFFCLCLKCRCKKLIRTCIYVFQWWINQNTQIYAVHMIFSLFYLGNGNRAIHVICIIKLFNKQNLRNMDNIHTYKWMEDRIHFSVTEERSENVLHFWFVVMSVRVHHHAPVWLSPSSSTICLFQICNASTFNLSCQHIS